MRTGTFPIFRQVVAAAAAVLRATLLGAFAAATATAAAASATTPPAATSATPATSAATAHARAAPGSVLRDCANCPELVVIPPGRFRMGSNEGESDRPEGPVREVTIARAFAIGRGPVTYEEFAAFVDATGHRTGPGCKRWDADQRAVIEAADATWRDPGFGKPPHPREPVVCVSWHDAQAYAAWLAKRTGEPYRLPTEAEWEYVARAGSTTAYPWGDDPEQGCRHANVYDASAKDPSKFWPHTECSDGWPGPSPVGTFPANAFGAYDLIGNVWEWLQDCYVVPYPATPTDGSAVEPATCERRSVRGGSWQTIPNRQRASFRGRDPEDLRNWIFGFRIARDLR